MNWAISGFVGCGRWGSAGRIQGWEMAMLGWSPVTPMISDFASVIPSKRKPAPNTRFISISRCK